MFKFRLSFAAFHTGHDPADVNTQLAPLIIPMVTHINSTARGLIELERVPVFQFTLRYMKSPPRKLGTSAKRWIEGGGLSVAYWLLCGQNAQMSWWSYWNACCSGTDKVTTDGRNNKIKALSTAKPAGTIINLISMNFNVQELWVWQLFVSIGINPDKRIGNEVLRSLNFQCFKKEF